MKYEDKYISVHRRDSSLTSWFMLTVIHLKQVQTMFVHSFFLSITHSNTYINRHLLVWVMMLYSFIWREWLWSFQTPADKMTFISRGKSVASPQRYQATGDVYESQTCSHYMQDIQHRCHFYFVNQPLLIFEDVQMSFALPDWLLGLYADWKLWLRLFFN